MEGAVSLGLWLMIALQMIPAKWILCGLDKEVPKQKNVLLLALGLLGLEVVALMFIAGVMSSYDPADLIEAIPLIVLGAGGPAGLLAIAIVRIRKDRTAAAALPQQERCIYWIDVLLRLGVMQIPPLAGAWAILDAGYDMANHPVFNGIVICSVLAEVVLLILRLVLARKREKRKIEAMTPDELLEYRVMRRVSKTVYEQWTPEQREEAKKVWKLREEDKIGRKHGVWAENPYEPLSDAEADISKEDVKEDQRA